MNPAASHDFAMTAAFFTLSMCEIFQSFNMRSRRQNVFTLKSHNKLLWGAMALSLTLTLLVIYVPPLARIFSLQPLTAFELVVGLLLSASGMLIIEGVKAFQRAYAKKQRKDLPC